MQSKITRFCAIFNTAREAIEAARRAPVVGAAGCIARAPMVCENAAFPLQKVSSKNS